MDLHQRVILQVPKEIAKGKHSAYHLVITLLDVVDPAVLYEVPPNIDAARQSASYIVGQLHQQRMATVSIWARLAGLPHMLRRETCGDEKEEGEWKWVKKRYRVGCGENPHEGEGEGCKWEDGGERRVECGSFGPG